jgi:hypothetical protein
MRHAGGHGPEFSHTLGPAKLRLQPFPFRHITGDPIDPHRLTGVILDDSPAVVHPPHISVLPHDAILDIKLSRGLKVPHGLFSQGTIIGMHERQP